MHPQTILFRRALAIATMDEERRVLRDADLLVEGRAIKAVGAGLEERADRVIDAGGLVLVPGLVNTHHHLYQTLTRCVPRVQDCELFDWLLDLYELWREIGPEAVYASALVGLGELLLSGCTTAADHLYLFPRANPGDLIAEEVRAARDLGIRFHPTRGSMSLGRSQGGLPPDDVVQSEDEILADSERAIERFHDPDRFSMCRVALAPCSPFSVTGRLLEQAADLARRRGVRLHTHLCETRDEERFCLERYGLRPLAYMERVGWVGPDVWYAHGIFFDDREIELLGRTRTGIAHCPVSNLRLGSGIARVPALRKAGVPVGLAVDGSASNDCSNLLAEARQAMLIHRVGTGIASMRARDALEIATLGGAAVLGRDDVGRLAPGFAADIAAFDVRGIAHAGALHDPVAALLFCGGSERARFVVVNGEMRVEEGRLVSMDETEIASRANRIAREMVERAGARTGIDFLSPRPSPAAVGPRSGAP